MHCSAFRDDERRRRSDLSRTPLARHAARLAYLALLPRLHTALCLAGEEASPSGGVNRPGFHGDSVA